MSAFSRLSLAKQYMLVSLLVMLGGLVVIGFWVSRQIETAVTNRTAAVTALYVDSHLSPFLQPLAARQDLAPTDLDSLQTLLDTTPLGQQIVSFKVWSPNGTVLYSPIPELIGQQFAVQGGLAKALQGNVTSEISHLDDPEQVFERQHWETLIETYAPIRQQGSDDIIAVAEFYQTTDELTAVIHAAQVQSWLAVGGGLTAVYLLLASLVQRASNTITSQQTTLHHNVTQLQTLLTQNKQLHNRVRRAAARSTALNEQYLRRISADLHDGPAQDLALALLRLEPLAEEIGSVLPADTQQDLHTIHLAVESALRELRIISAGLRLPEIQTATLHKTIQRAIHDHEQKTSTAVTTELHNLPANAPFPVKITLYRLLKEALSNSYRHAQGKGQTVRITADPTALHVTISDTGPGLPSQEPTDAPPTQLGLIGMRERVELLGGQFDIHSTPNQGTTLHATLPLDTQEDFG